MLNQRTEQRKVRPYLNIEVFEGLLNGVKVSINGKALRGEKEYLEPKVFSDLVLDIEISLNETDISLCARELGLDLHQIQFSLIAYGNTFKKSAILRSWKLSENIKDRSLTLHSSDLPEVFMDKFGGFNIVFVLTLAENLEPKPLKVYLSGTWLVKREFQIRPDQDVSFFSPMPMDSAKKKELNLPTKALIYLEYGDEGIEFATSIEDVIKVWVDEGVLTSLQNDKSSTADVTAMMLARTAIGSLIEQIGQLFNSEEFDLQQYGEALSSEVGDERVLTKFVKRAHKVLGSNDWALTLQAIKEDPQKVATKIEAQADLRDSIKKALTKDD
jgi:hypothetical protein